MAGSASRRHAARPQGAWQVVQDVRRTRRRGRGRRPRTSRDGGRSGQADRPCGAASRALPGDCVRAVPLAGDRGSRRSGDGAEKRRPLPAGGERRRRRRHPAGSIDAAAQGRLVPAQPHQRLRRQAMAGTGHKLQPTASPRACVRGAARRDEADGRGGGHLHQRLDRAAEGRLLRARHVRRAVADDPRRVRNRARHPRRGLLPAVRAVQRGDGRDDVLAAYRLRPPREGDAAGHHLGDAHRRRDRAVVRLAGDLADAAKPLRGSSGDAPAA